MAIRKLLNYQGLGYLANFLVNSAQKIHRINRLSQFVPEIPRDHPTGSNWLMKNGIPRGLL